MNGNRKLTVPFVELFLLLVLGWKTLVVVSVNLLFTERDGVRRRQKQNIQLPVAVLGPRTSVLQLLTRPSLYIISFFFFLFARPTASRRIPGHIREFNWLEPHLDNEMVFKTWQN